MNREILVDEDIRKRNLVPLLHNSDAKLAIITDERIETVTPETEDRAIGSTKDIHHGVVRNVHSLPKELTDPTGVGEMVKDFELHTNPHKVKVPSYV
jgi:hypothetical protein